MCCSQNPKSQSENVAQPWHKKKGAACVAHPFSEVSRNFGLRLQDRSLFPAENPYLPLNGSKKFTLWFDSNLHNAVIGGPTWIRTRDRPVMSRWLCQLSYGPFASTAKIRILFNDVYLRNFVYILAAIFFVKRNIPAVVISPPSGFDSFLPAPTRSSAINKTLEFLAPAGVSKLSQGLGFDLPNALPGYQKILAHLL